MKPKKQIQNRINTLEFNNDLVSDEKGKELNQVRIDELKLILITPEHNLYSKLQEFNKLNRSKKSREIQAKMAQIEWALKNDCFRELEGGNR